MRRHGLYAIPALVLLLLLGSAFAQSPAPWTDFGEYETGQVPSDWSPLWETAGEWTISGSSGPEGGKTLTTTGKDVMNSDSIVWDRVGVVSDVQVLALMRSEDQARESRLILRASGTAGDENGYVFDVRSTNEQARILRFTDGTPVVLASEPHTTDITDWNWIRAEAVGDNLRLRTWPHGEPEPEDWMVNVTDANHTTGSVGVLQFHVSAIPHVDWFSFAETGQAPGPDDVEEPAPPEPDTIVLETSLDPWLPILIWGVAALFFFMREAWFPGFAAILALAASLPDPEVFPRVAQVLLVILALLVHVAWLMAGRPFVGRRGES